MDISNEGITLFAIWVPLFCPMGICINSRLGVKQILLKRTFLATRFSKLLKSRVSHSRHSDLLFDVLHALKSTVALHVLVYYNQLLGRSPHIKADKQHVSSSAAQIRIEYWNPK